MATEFILQKDLLKSNLLMQHNWHRWLMKLPKAGRLLFWQRTVNIRAREMQTMDSVFVPFTARPV